MILSICVVCGKVLNCKNNLKIGGFKMDFLYEVLIEPFNDGYIGCVFGCFMWFFTLVVMGFIFYGMYYSVDSVGTPIKQGMGVVIRKEFTPAYSTTTMVMSGNVMVPVTNHYPDSWNVTVENDYGIDSINVSHSYYNNIKKGNWVKIEFCTGRMSGGFYLKKVL